MLRSVLLLVLVVVAVSAATTQPTATNTRAKANTATATPTATKPAQATATPTKVATPTAQPVKKEAVNAKPKTVKVAVPEAVQIASKVARAPVAQQKLNLEPAVCGNIEYVCGPADQQGSFHTSVSANGENTVTLVIVSGVCPPPPPPPPPVPVPNPNVTGSCALSYGYWKTHSKYGPAPYDSTWALVGEDTPFFHSMSTWYSVLLVTPRTDYYKLAIQYVGAQLNFLNGAYQTSAVLSAFNQATTLLNTYSPTNLPGDTSLFVSLAAELEAYNADSCPS